MDPGQGQVVEHKPQEAGLEHPKAEHFEAEHRSGGALGRAGEQVVQQMASDGPALDFDIPPVIDMEKFGADFGARNVAINASYHEYDKSITRYLGQPFVANWATFGKHASAHVGSEMAGANESLRLIDSLGSVDRLIGDVEKHDVLGAMRELNKCMEAVNKIDALLKKKGVASQGAAMAMHFVKEALHEIKAALTTPDPNPIHKVQNAVGKLKGVLPKARGEISNMLDQLKDGNKNIYANVAPALNQFLTQVQGAKGGITSVTVQGDKDGFFGAAFKHWVEARRLTNELSDPSKADQKDLLAKRLAEVRQGNMILVTHEQMVAQPDYDRMQPQMQALSGTMVLVDPDGAHALLPNGGNWGDFHERLGYDKSKSPDMKHVDPNNLPPLLDKTDPRFKGSIADYFDDNATNKDLAQAPSVPQF